MGEVLPQMQKHRESIEEIQRDLSKKKANRSLQRASELEHGGQETVNEKVRVLF